MSQQNYEDNCYYGSISQYIKIASLEADTRSAFKVEYTVLKVEKKKKQNHPEFCKYLKHSDKEGSAVLWVPHNFKRLTSSFILALPFSKLLKSEVLIFVKSSDLLDSSLKLVLVFYNV